jgi:hypothetical protein
MAWLTNRRLPTKRVRPAGWRTPFQAHAPSEASRETSLGQFAVRLAVMFGFALVTPGFHLRSLAALSAALGMIVAYGAACARERLDLPGFSAWDEAVTFFAIAWLAYRLL